MAIKKKKTVSSTKNNKFFKVYNHKRNLFENKIYRFQQPISKNDLQPGMIITFSYKGIEVHDPHPLVLVLNKKWLGKLHGINLNYCNYSQINAIAKVVNRKVYKIQEKLGLRYRIVNPYGFYHTGIKPVIRGFGRSVYRTYFVSGISQVKLLDFKFQKEQGQQLLVFTDKKGQTQVQLNKVKPKILKINLNKKPQEIQHTVNLTKKEKKKNVKVIPNNQLLSAQNPTKVKQVKKVSNVSSPVVSKVKEK